MLWNGGSSLVSVFLAGGSLGGAERSVARRRPAWVHARVPYAVPVQWIIRHVDVVVSRYKMDFQSAMETFAEAWAAANTVKTENNEMAQVSWEYKKKIRQKKPPNNKIEIDVLTLHKVLLPFSCLLST